MSIVDADVEVIGPDDEASQTRADERLLEQTLLTFRQQMATLKVNYHLAKHGLLVEGLHPNQIEAQIMRMRASIDLCKGLLRDGCAEPGL